MFLIDDILLSPAHGLMWIFKEIHKVAREDMDNEPESISQQLRNLYMQLEASAISEQQFDTQEKVLLDRLDEIEGDSEIDETLEETTVHGKG